ncbi:MAG TPA: SRPBCC family protein [Chitinophagaceae bacterium]|nr:SRPBCC family protein [Chitinophagaceae bacterium]
MVITVETLVTAPIEKTWAYWTGPEHITQWNNASDDWHTPWAKNNLVPGGRFECRMEAKDGSMGFEFGGVYDEVIDKKLIAYTMDDNRKVTVRFSESGNGTKVLEEFDAEDQNPAELQQQGWQAILNNFKKYTESH